MNLKQIKLKHWWRELLVLVVCLFAGRDVVQAEIQFSSAPTNISHQPTMKEPYIVVEVLYFDAEGKDSYFTTAAQESGHNGPAVYMKKSSESTYKWVCSPFAELAWNTHQKTAEGEINDQNDWWKSSNPELASNQKGIEHDYYNNDNDILVKFYDPHRRTDRPSGEYYVYMYIFVKEFKVGDSYDIKIRGTWKVNDHSPSVQEKVLTTDTFSSLWKTPSAVLTADKKVTVYSEKMPTTLSGNTTVGIYTESKTAPSGYVSPNTLGSYKEINKSNSSYSAGTVPAATFNYDYDYLNGGTIPVQYSYSFSSSVNSRSPRFGGSAPIVYKWFNAFYPGFVYPKNVKYEVTDQWKKKVKLSWEAEETQTKTVGSIVVASYSRSQAGTWKIKNLKTNTTVSIDKYATQSGETVLDGYSIGNNFKKEDIYVYFVPKDYSGDPIESLGDSVQAMIRPKWSFSNLEAKESETQGIDLSWSHNALEDATNSNKYYFTLQRSTDYDTSTDEGNWTDVTSSIEVKDKTTVDGSYNDNSNQNSNTTYHYRLKAQVMDMTAYSGVASVRIGGSKIKTFTATRGNYSSMVKLQWTVKQAGTTATNYILQRRPLGSKDERDWADIYATSGTVTSYSYDDVTALPGSFNEYRIIIWSTLTDESTHVTTQVVDDSQTTDGFSVSTGIISGNISYGTGTAVEGAKVILKQQTADGSLANGMHSLYFSGYGSGLKYATDKVALKALFDTNFSFQMYLNPNSAVMSAENGEYQLLYVADVLDVKLKRVVGTKEVTEMVEVTTGEGEEQTTTYEERTTEVTVISYRLSGTIGSAAIASTLSVPANEWSHLSLVYDSNAKTLTAYLTKSDETQSEVVATTSVASIWGSSEANGLFFGNAIVNIIPEGQSEPVPTEFASSYQYDGYLDEIRFFTKALTEQEILRNYNHLLAGNEAGLAIYYPLDEGIENQDIAYDFSKKNGVSNARHASAKLKASSTTVLPSENQLSLMSYTDVNGYYEIRGVPFSGEGTSYSVIPILGIHEFTPAKQSRYVSISTLNHSGVDFNDVSSFPVSGTIFYAGTDYPVEGVNFYVDGTICSRDGEIVATNEQGEFTISVPIGDHFITAKKNGHVFANAGRYPADPNDVGTKHTFDREIKNMEFTDETLVNFTGRVVGGDIEGNKTVGFGLSKNNIGKVQLVLTPKNTNPRMNVVKQTTETSYSYETNTETVPIASATDRIASDSWRGSGVDNCRKLFIVTDPETGEFSAMLPPLEYDIAPMKVVATDTEFGKSSSVDLTNCQLEFADTLYNDNGTYELYNYNTCLKQTYHSDPTFIVTQADHIDEAGINDGAFGIKTYTVKDNVNGDLTINDIYSVNEQTGAVTYKYGGAVFEESEKYTFDIEAYEDYTNYDETTPVSDRVPLADLVVTINNALSDQQPIFVSDFSQAELAAAGYDGDSDVTAGQVVDLQSNQLRLDSLGKASYVWTAGMPNVTSPYTRTISMTYDIAGCTYPWEKSGMEGVVLGALPTGSNFITSGPDMVDMVLRDPPGSNSSAEWTSGSIVTLSNVVTANFSSSTEATTTTKLGTDFKTVSGFGVSVLNEAKYHNDLVVGLTTSVEAEGAYSWSRTVETTKTISTSDDPDFVGAAGDVYIGSSTNIIIGKANSVDFVRDGENGVKLNCQSIWTSGLSFTTAFNYTQHYIENILLPNLEEQRNALLRGEHGENIVSSDIMNEYVNGTRKNMDSEHPLYLTTLPESDPRFGSNNHDKDVWGAGATGGISSDGPSYKMFLADGVEFAEDKIVWYNNQIDLWKKQIKLNEEHKVKAFENRDKNATNYSFDAGSKITKTVETNESHGGSFMVHGEVGFKFGMNGGAIIDGTGVLFELANETKIGLKEEFSGSKATKTVFSYTLAESGTDDALTVDVYDYDDYGPIFRTRGGQTSAPYEGKEVTKYYEPGTTIMEATMQIEVPQIDVDVPVISDVPTGSAANYTLRLGNASEVNKDVTYKLFVLDGTNPDGAQIIVDGQVLTEGRLINVQGGQTVSKSLQLKQSQVSILNYDGNNVVGNELYGKGIGIVFASESQPEDIADTVFIKARFTPSSSPVSLALSNSIMNTQTGTDLTLTFKDFDRNYNNLKAFRLEYKKQGATDWTQFKEYVLGEPTGKQEKLPSSGASVSYKLPMSSFSDGEYIFRVVSASTYGAGEVYRYSEELSLNKDMQRPTPLGQPEPSNGILNIGDDLSVTFNETILKSELTKVANFKVTGVLNGAPVAHWTALSMQNTNATAATEASINLAGKDFSFDAWVNLSAGAGTLLSHGSGTARFAVGVDANSKLVINIADKTYTSVKTIPTGKWAFLTLSYQSTANGGILNASVADDASETSLFEDQTVVRYSGNGPLVVGKGINGAIHEVLLWDEAHDLTVALLNRSKTKNPSTRHLIGYWKMDEGEGTSIRDYSRNRHMTMANATWYLNNANKSVVLDGLHYLSIDASQLPVCVDDDYAIEFWMRGAKQNEDQQLLQMGEIGLWVTADGKLQFTGKNVYDDAEALNFATSAEALTDNAWHHVVVNVLRQGASAVYVDGVRCLTISSSNVGAINTNNLLIGRHRITVSAETGVYSYDRPFTGQIDEVRVWNATMNSEMLLKNRKVRLTGTEEGLIAYYPFETQTLDEGNQVVSVGSAKDLTGSLNAQMLPPSGNTTDLIYTDEAPAMRQKPTETNVSFTFVASNEKIVINIDEDPATIEGCTLNFTVRDVRDENGNYSVPAVWSAFVNRKELAWDEEELNIKQEVKDESSVTATIVNKSGTQQMWTLSGMPEWLTASSEYGTTNPLAQSKVIFTVSPATAVGKYQETIYLKSNNGIETPLTLNVTVTGQVPSWSVNANDFENSMNVIGRVMVEGVPMDDTDDIVAAFIGEECRGVAHPVYSARYDSYFVTMDIYGNSENNQDVTFRAYDASTGTLYPEVSAENNIKFAPLSLQGSYGAPVVLTAQDKIEQLLELKAGWNWISLYVTTTDMTVPALFEKIADDVITIKSQTKYLSYENGSWKGELTTGLANNEMYAVKMKSDRTLRLVGARVNPAASPITIYKGWNWIGYYGRQVASVKDALADIGAQNGDNYILKGQSGVTYWDTYEWSGSLIMMEPGVGYVMKSEKTDPTEFSYPSSALAPRRGSSENTPATTDAHQYTFNAIDYRTYSGNAIMAAKVMNGNVAMSNVEIGVFVDDECRTVAVTDQDGIAYLTIPGDDAAILTFKVAQGDAIYDAVDVVNFETDAIYGTPANPFVINLNTTTKVAEIDGAEENESVYDLQGRKVEQSTGYSEKGILIINGQKRVVR